METAATWSERLAAITGWKPATVRVIDWPSVEARLGTVLPADYKQLAGRFGTGAFDGYLFLSTPDTPSPHHDLIDDAKWLAEQAAADPWIGDLYRPHPVFPAAGGVLRWADSAEADSFCWLTESADPDAWPILAQAHGDVGGWARFDGSTSEFIYRILTDRRQPFSVARHFDTHTFESYEQIREPDDEWDADPYR